MDLQNQKVTSYQIVLQTYTSLGDTWVAQSLEHETLDFGSGHDLRGPGIQPCIGLPSRGGGGVGLRISLPLPLPFPPPHLMHLRVLSPKIYINKSFKN